MPEGIENESGEVNNDSNIDSKADSPDASKKTFWYGIGDWFSNY